MDKIEFTSEVCEKLGYYVYRLVDPRNGQTFYVGKGKGNRVFAHSRDELKSFEKGEDAESAKLNQIRDIRNSGLQVIHIIQRWGMNEKTAFEVESALIDCYSGLTNLQSGHESERGVINAETLAKNFTLPCFEAPADVDFMIIKTTQARIDGPECNGDVYKATRYAWKIQPKKAEGKYVLGVVDGVVRGVYEVDGSWYEALPERPGRYAFNGHPAPKEVQDIFLNKRIPDIYYGKGQANPVRYKK